MNKQDMFENYKVNLILHNFLKYKSHIVFDVICDNHLAIFYPLPYFELDTINKSFSSMCKHQHKQMALQNASKYCQVVFHWVELKQLLIEDFRNKHISAFDY